MGSGIAKGVVLAALWLGAAFGLHAQTVVEYIHTDALGTPVAVTNSAGAVIERSVYEPYGQLINRPLTDGPGFTGHVQDAATGLTYMQQRYYDPQLGVFLSVDPVTAYSDPVGQFNQYRYANNNPYRMVDPDGRQAKDRGSLCRNPARCKAVVQVNPNGSSTSRAATGAGAVAIGSRVLPSGSASGGSAVQTGGRVLAGMASAPVAAIVAGVSALAYSSDVGVGSDEPPPMILYHGTSVSSGVGFLNGMRLSRAIAVTNNLHGMPGFYLATDPGMAQSFGAYHADAVGSTVIQFSVSSKALFALASAGARFQPIPQGGLAQPPVGNEFYVPISAFGVFNSMMSSGQIIPVPYISD